MIEATAFILIGGKSQRFGSEKWKAELGSHMILDHIWEACSDFKYQIIIGKIKPKNINKPFILDHFKIQAPIIGLHSAIISSNTEWILLLSCDIPLINKSCLEFIWNSKIKDVESVIPIINNQIHPLCGLYHKSILHKLNSVLEIKEFSLQKFLKSINTQYINMNNHKKKFINMNTKKDFEKIKTIYTNSEN